MDPVTIALLAAQGIAGTAKAGYGLYQQSQGRKALAGAYEAPTGKPSEYADMLKQARASDLAQRRIDEINRSMATSTSALQQSGSRGVIGGIGAVTEAGSRAKTGALTAQQQEIMRALERGTIGGEYERQRGVARQTREETAAQSAITAGIQNVAGGLGDIGMAAATGIDAYTALDKTNDININKSMLSDKEQARREEEEARRNTAKKGMKVQKTPGAFSHSENPLDIMQDGAKIGEMTGGEYIFNPNQAKEMKKLASSGNTDLHKFVKSLLNKPQFK
tara:strand:+ start:71 stop:904 length:834 start_codon:yes stop_codon:yes gene_type:complete